MAFDFLVRAFFTDSGLSAGLAKANDQIKQLKRSGPDAGQGVRSVEQGIRMLAFQAAGVPGPLGRVASGFLQIGGGSALMVGAVAGLALVGIAIRALTADARENAEAQKAMIAELEKVGPHGQIEAARIRLSQLEAQRDDPTFLQRAGMVGREFLQSIIGGAGSTDQGQREALDREIAKQRNIIGARSRDLAGVDTGDVAQRSALEGRDTARARQHVIGAEMGVFEQGQSQERLIASDTALAEAVRRVALEYDHVEPSIAKKVAAQERENAVQNLTNDASLEAYRLGREAEIVNSMLGASQEDVNAALRAYHLVLKGVNPAAAEMIAKNEKIASSSMKTAQVLRTQLPQAFAAMGAAATESMQAVVQSAIQSVAQIAQSLPGVTPLASGVIGLVGGILGGLFGRSRPMPVEVTNTKDFQPEGIERFTLQIISSSTGEMMDQIVYELGRRTRLDRVIRIPRGTLMSVGG